MDQTKKLTLKHAQYFEGNLQLRNCPPEIKAWVEDRNRRDGKALITKEKKMPNGVDLFFSDQHYMQALGKKLKEEFSGEYKVTATLHTRSHITSKELFRITILFRGLPFKVGDVLTVNGRKLRVWHMAKQAFTQDLDSGKRERWKLRELEKYVR